MAREISLSFVEPPPPAEEVQTAVSTGAMLGGGRDVRSMYISYNNGTDWELTYSNSPSLSAAQGKMVTARMVQACYYNDPNVDATIATLNAAHFRDQLEAYRSAGVLCWAVGMEGGNVFKGSGAASVIDQTGISYGINNGRPSAFVEDGTSLKSDFKTRFELLIEAMNEQGMIICLNLFYGRQGGWLDNQTAYESACETVTDWLITQGYRNVCIDIANEAGADASGTWPTGHIFKADSTTAAMVEYFIGLWTGEPWRPPVGCSSRSKPGPLVLAESDIHWFHGNVAGSPMPSNRDDWIQDILDDTTIGPVVCNEDEPQTEENGYNEDQWDEEMTAFTAMNDITGASGGTMIVNSWQRWHADTELPFWPEPSGSDTSLDSGLSFKVRGENFTQRWLNLVETETGGLPAP